MKRIPCPLNGWRDASEFVQGGEVRPMPDGDAPDAAWADHVFLHDNRKGVVREWWCHLPTSYWFVLERDTATDRIIRSYDPAELFAR